jgi:hypothetical protein
MADAKKLLGGLNVVKKLLAEEPAAETLLTAADRAAAGRKAAELIKSQPPTKASEALGQLMERGMKRVTTTQADRTRVGGGNIGGANFPAISEADPAYKDKVWGVMDEGTASRLKNLATPDTAWTTMLGSANQLKTNPVVFDKLKRQFIDGMKQGKLSPELEAKINHNLALNFGEGASIRDPGIWKQADTFEKRAALADLMMGQGIPPKKGGVALGGEKSGKGVIFKPTETLIKETEPTLLHPEHGGNIDTFAAGPRLFRLEKESVNRPDLHPGFPTLLKGEDLGYNMEPVPTEIFLPTWHKEFREKKPERFQGPWAQDIIERRKSKDYKMKGAEGPGYYDLALGLEGEGLPSQALNDEYIRHLLREGFKEGGEATKEPSALEQLQAKIKSTIHEHHMAAGGGAFKTMKFDKGGRASAAKTAISLGKRLFEDAAPQAEALSLAQKRALKVGQSTDQRTRMLQQGYEDDWYHGSTGDIKKFNPNFLGESTGAPSAKKGYFFARDPSTPPAQMLEHDAESINFLKSLGKPIPPKPSMKGHGAHTAGSYAGTGGSRDYKEAMRKAHSAEKSGNWDEYEKYMAQAEDSVISDANYRQTLVAKHGDARDDMVEKINNAWYGAQNSERFKNMTQAEYESYDRLHKELMPYGWYNSPLYDAPQFENLMGRISSVTGDKHAKEANDAIKKYLSVRNERAASELESGANVMPVALRYENPMYHDFEGKPYREQSYSDLIDEAKRNGHDALILKNTFDPGGHSRESKMVDIGVMFEPDQIRSKFAAFDPLRVTSATAAAAGLAPPDLLAKEKKAHGGLARAFAGGGITTGAGSFSPEDVGMTAAEMNAPAIPAYVKQNASKLMDEGRAQLEKEYSQLKTPQGRADFIKRLGTALVGSPHDMLHMGLELGDYVQTKIPGMSKPESVMLPSNTKDRVPKFSLADLHTTKEGDVYGGSSGFNTELKRLKFLGENEFPMMELPTMLFGPAVASKAGRGLKALASKAK